MKNKMSLENKINEIIDEAFDCGGYKCLHKNNEVAIIKLNKLFKKKFSELLGDKEEYKCKYGSDCFKCLPGIYDGCSIYAKKKSRNDIIDELKKKIDEIN